MNVDLIEFRDNLNVKDAIVTITLREDMSSENGCCALEPR